MSSDSEDDRPLARRVPKTAAKTSPSPRPRARTKIVAESDDDEDNTPLAFKAKRKPPTPTASPVAKPKQQAKPQQARPQLSTQTSPANGKKPASPAAKTQPKKRTKADPDKPDKPKVTFELPGQTRASPDETDPLRKFYTSLLNQRPDSQMAKKWCVTYGLLAHEHAQAWVDEMKQAKGRTPVKVKREQPSPAKVKREQPSPLKVKREQASPVKVKREQTSGAIKKEQSSPAKRPPPAKPRPQPRKEADDDEDDFKAPLQQVKRKATNGAANRPAKRILKKEQFTFDDSDSEDDVPLVKRARALVK